MSQAAPQFANRLGYSDIEPFEVVRVVSERCLEIRAMRAERDPSWQPEWIPGGFAGHCLNQAEQRWVIQSDPNGRVLRIRLGRNGWRSADRDRFEVADQPRRFYDYNF